MRNPNDRPVAVDLFCGCGAASLGLVRAGYRVAAAVDNDPVACASYRANHPDVLLLQSDIGLVDPSDIRRVALADADADLMVVCAPCQPFSSQNRNRAGDGRAGLILHAVRFAEALRPGVIFFENVPGLASSANSSVLDDLRRGLAGLGYDVGEPARIDAADFGVPQRRKRCILTASAPGVPPPTVPSGDFRSATVRQAIGNLPRLASGQRDPLDPLHAARKHHPLNMERLRRIPKNGGSRFSLPPELELRCHRGHGGHPDVYGRMSWDDVAPTLTTGCTDITRGRFAHPEDDRAITPREAARLQTFPDDFVFRGMASDIARQIGNAVPPLLVERLAEGLRPGRASSSPEGLR